MRPPPQPPTGWACARTLARNAWRASALLVRRRVHQPTARLGEQVRFADATRAVVYRETVVDCPPATEPALLVVGFKARGVRTEAGHARYRRQSAVIIPFVVGHPGFVSKLWLGHDVNGRYRGLYEWDGERNAEAYAGVLHRLLAPVIVPGSLRHRVVPGLRRADVLNDPRVLDHVTVDGPHVWWRLDAADVNAA